MDKDTLIAYNQYLAKHYQKRYEELSACNDTQKVPYKELYIDQKILTEFLYDYLETKEKYIGKLEKIVIKLGE